MKKIIFTILCMAWCALAFSQDDETELKEEIIAVNIGLVGGWISYEKHLSGLFTLKSELGLDGGIEYDFLYGETYLGFTPSIRLEPRYYYSFNRRVRLGKKTLYNASNYIALSATYIPGLFTISNVDGSKFQRSAEIVAKWGIKRTVGQRFNFEFAIGPGLYIDKTTAEATAGLDLRFGYNIK